MLNIHTFHSYNMYCCIAQQRVDDQLDITCEHLDGVYKAIYILRMGVCDQVNLKSSFYNKLYHQVPKIFIYKLQQN